MTTHTETTAPGAPTLTIDGAVATLQLNRPEVANRLNPDDLALIRRHIRTVNESPALVLRLRSTGKYFCSGFDIGVACAGPAVAARRAPPSGRAGRPACSRPTGWRASP